MYKSTRNKDETGAKQMTRLLNAVCAIRELYVHLTVVLSWAGHLSSPQRGKTDSLKLRKRSEESCSREKTERAPRKICPQMEEIEPLTLHADAK